MTDGRRRSLSTHMRLDDLLSELQVRLEAVLATRDRVHALLEAVVSVGSDLDLETVLHRIVATAATLVDAGYGALGVIGEERTLVQFVPVGLAAGVAIENARLYEDTRRRETWLQASAEITTSLLSGAEPSDVLARLARRAGDGRRRRRGRPAADDARQDLQVVLADGEAADSLTGRRVPVAGSLAGAALLGGEPVRLNEPAETDLLTLTAEHLAVGPVAAVPLGAAGGARGVLGGRQDKRQRGTPQVRGHFST
ncbi:hypothetical protein [Planomonospora algeriensis]